MIPSETELVPPPSTLSEASDQPLSIEDMEKLQKQMIQEMQQKHADDVPPPPITPVEPVPLPKIEPPKEPKKRKNQKKKSSDDDEDFVPNDGSSSSSEEFSSDADNDPEEDDGPSPEDEEGEFPDLLPDDPLDQPKTAYQFFQKCVKKKIEDEHPTAPASQIRAMLTKMWRGLSEEERDSYKKIHYEMKAKRAKTTKANLQYRSNYNPPPINQQFLYAYQMQMQNQINRIPTQLQGVPGMPMIPGMQGGRGINVIPRPFPQNGQVIPQQFQPRMQRIPGMGPIPQGPIPQGPIPQGPIPQGPIPQGPIPQGPIPQGPIPQGPIPQGPIPQGPIPQGPIPQGQQNVPKMMNIPQNVSPQGMPQTNPQFQRIQSMQVQRPAQPGQLFNFPMLPGQQIPTQPMPLGAQNPPNSAVFIKDDVKPELPLNPTKLVSFSNELAKPKDEPGIDAEHIAGHKRMRESIHHEADSIPFNPLAQAVEQEDSQQSAAFI